MSNLYFRTFLLSSLLLLNSACLYKKHPVKASTEKLANQAQTDDVDSLAQYLLAQMSLKEKLDQMTGEPNLAGLIKLGANFLVLKRFPHL